VKRTHEKKPADPPAQFQTLRATAMHLQRTERTLQGWKCMAGCPSGPPFVRAEWEAFAAEKAAARPGAGKLFDTELSPLSAAKLALTQQQARKITLVTDRIAGETWPKALCLRDLLVLIHLWRTNVELLPEQLEMGFPAECRAESKAETALRCRGSLEQIMKHEFGPDGLSVEQAAREAAEWILSRTEGET